MNYLTLTAAMLITIPAFSQQQNAEELLKQLSEKNQSYENIQADFSFQYKSMQSDDQRQWNGTILMKGEKYKLELSQSTIYYDGTTLWNYLHEPNEVNVSEPPKGDQTDIINHPQQIFEIYKKDFKYQYLDKKNINGQQLHLIDLYPKELEKDYSRIRLYLTPEEIQIHSAEIFAKDGSRYRIEINNIKPNQPVDDSTFVFNKKAHPDAEVIDMRF